MADSVSKFDQYQRAASLLDYSQSYSSRVAGAATLVKLAKEYPKEYDEQVMKCFAAFLSHPPVYGKGHPNEGGIDFGSRDTVIIIESVNARKRQQRANYKLTLRIDGPFTICENGDVQKNTSWSSGRSRPQPLHYSAAPSSP